MDKVEKIFNELKEKEIIDKNRKIYDLGEIKSFILIARKTIFYDKDILVSFSDDQIKFLFLHEEGHFRNNSWVRKLCKLCKMVKYKKRNDFDMETTRKHFNEFLADSWVANIMDSKLNYNNKKILKIIEGIFEKIKKDKISSGCFSDTHPSNEDRIFNIKKELGLN